MAFEYQPLPPPVQAVNPLAGFTGGLTNSLGAVQQLQGQGYQNALMQEKIQRNKDVKNAMAGYKEGGDVTAIMKADPEFGVKFVDALSKMDERGQKQLLGGMKFLEMALPMVTSPEQLIPLKEDLAKTSPVIANRIPSPEQFKTPEEFQQWRKNALFNSEMIKQETVRLQSQGALERAHVIGQYGLQREAMQGGTTLEAARIRAEAERQYKPELIEYADGSLGFEKPEPGKKLPAGAKKARVQDPADIKKFAIKMATEAMGLETPGTPDYDAKFDALKNKFELEISGNVSQGSQATPGGGQEIKRTGNYNGRKVIQYKDGTIKYAD